MWYVRYINTHSFIHNKRLSCPLGITHYFPPENAFYYIIYLILYWPSLHLLYGSVSQGLGTTKSTNLISWNGYLPQSRFSRVTVKRGARVGVGVGAGAGAGAGWVSICIYLFFRSFVKFHLCLFSLHSLSLNSNLSRYICGASFPSPSFHNLLMIKIKGKTRLFDRASVIIKWMVK